MEQFSARALYQMGKLLEKVCTEHQSYRPVGDAAFAGTGVNQRLSSGRVIGLQEFMHEVGVHCLALGLKMSNHQVEDIILNAPKLTNGQAADGLVHLDKMIRWEMESHLFFFVTPGEADLYKQTEPLFGKEVEDHFPSASFDVSESGKCLALSRSTSCVMHLMRVLERGLNVFATELEVRFERREWENIINDLEVAIKAVNGPHAGDDWREKQRFYSEAAKDFRYFKNTWRNHAMHARERYDVDEAKPIFEHVKSFMEHLASKLHEKVEEGNSEDGDRMRP